MFIRAVIPMYPYSHDLIHQIPGNNESHCVTDTVQLPDFGHNFESPTKIWSHWQLAHKNTERRLSPTQQTQRPGTHICMIHIYKHIYIFTPICICYIYTHLHSRECGTKFDFFYVNTNKQQFYPNNFSTYIYICVGVYTYKCFCVSVCVYKYISAYNYT
jgi:hypothetical protein